MRVAPALLAIAAAGAALPGQEGAPVVRLAVAPTVLIEDSLPDPLLPGVAELHAAFERKVRSSFDAASLYAPTPDTPLNSGDRVVFLLPTIHAARVVHEEVSGVIHRFEAVVVGEVAAVDPWTGSKLDAGTRLVSVEVKLGESRLADRDSLLREAFVTGIDRWLDAVLGQLRSSLRPFVLDGTTLAPPAGVRLDRGGLWPWGAQRGVRPGKILEGPGGAFARVSQTFDRYSLIESVSAPDSPLPPGSAYRVTMVRDASERNEPRVAFTWMGSGLRDPAGIPGTGLRESFVTALLRDYVSKAGGLMVLPGQDPGEPARRERNEALRSFAERAELVEGEYLTFHRETIAQAALERPDAVVDVGVLDSYHGSKPGEGGRIEHLYRVKFLAAVYRPIGGSDYALIDAAEGEAEEARYELENVREPDHAATWFRLVRNASIELAGRIREVVLSSRVPELEATIDAEGRPAWPGSPPGPSQPLLWLRPDGTVRGPDGATLGPFFRVVKPEAGYLNPRILPQAGLRPGDVLRYRAGKAEGAPLPFLVVRRSEADGAVPETALLRTLAASVLGRGLGRPVVPLDDLRPFVSYWGAVPAAGLIVDGPRLGRTDEHLSASGKWQLTALNPAGTAGEHNPRPFCGIEYASRVPLADLLLDPLDVGAVLHRHTDSALEALMQECARKQVLEMLRH